ncbi:MAG: hypothetical protein MUF83_07825 [Acidimicrobiales bacterium]|nr:hypothetical protein [Acidimicrobiales bacterium]
MARAERVTRGAPTTGSGPGTRLLAAPEDRGPRVSLGVAWFVAVVAGLGLAPVALAALLAVVAGTAALQTARAWRVAGGEPDPLVAGVGCLVVVAAGAAGTALAGAALLVVVVVAVAASGAQRLRARSRTPWFAAAGLTVRCVVVPAAAGVALLALERLDVPAVLIVFALVSAYDAGCFVVGAGASNPVEGVVAGMVTSVVLTASLWVFRLPPFDGDRAAWVFGVLVAVTAPLGQVAASLSLPRASAWAPALRRLDTLSVTGLALAVALWAYID